MDKVKRHAKRTAVAIVGSVTLVIGIILIPYPGPGWLVVFAALAILSTEFEWAKRALEFVKGKYDDWQVWMLKQHPVVQLAFGLLTLGVVILTLWILNGYGVIDTLLHLHQQWLHSPVFR